MYSLIVTSHLKTADFFHQHPCIILWKIYGNVENCPTESHNVQGSGS